jgi:hypothetical protein
MKKIGELLAAFFDEDTLKMAQGYSDLFSSWRDIAGESLAAHSRISELERSVLRIEADHPGWIQILQTRQKGLLNRARRKFPSLNITGIAFRLSRNPPIPAREKTDGEQDIRPETEAEKENARIAPESAAESLQDLYAKINDDELRETLKRIGENC